MPSRNEQIKLHVLTMLRNQSFLNDDEVNDLVGPASEGDLDAYDKLLVIYRKHVSDTPGVIGRVSEASALTETIDDVRRLIREGKF